METEYLKLWKRAENYIGEEWRHYYVVVGRHRDSALLDSHNFDVIQEELEALASAHPNWSTRDEESTLIVNPSENHWAVGWVEWLGLHKDAPAELIARAEELLSKLEDYPILREDEFSEKEWSQAQEFWESLPLSERVDLCREHRVSIFAARHGWIPQQDNGGIFEYCRPE